MNTKRFLLLSLLTLLTVIPALACGYMPPVERYYIFYMPEKADCYHERLYKELTRAWSGLLQCALTTEDIDDIGEYDPADENTSDHKIFAVARAKGMNDVLDYLSLLYQYNKHGIISYNDWNYPTAEEIARQKSMLTSIYEKAAAYSGTRLADQYHLLMMRTAFTAKDWARCHEIYDKYIGEARGTIFADMMDDLYAGVLYREGKNVEAFTIYSRLGDHSSASWCAANTGDLAVIQGYYDSDPNSPSIPWLLREFCNNLQETRDAMDDSKNVSEYWDTPAEFIKSRLEMYEAQNISEAEVAKFMLLVDEAVNNPAVKDPCYWYAAAALAQYYCGNYSQAAELLAKGENSRGTSDSALTLEYIAMFVNIANEKSEDKANALAATYLKRLRDLECQDFDNTDSHARRMTERLLRAVMIPRFAASGDWQRYLAAYALLPMQQEDLSITVDSKYGDYNPFYRTEYFNALDRVPIEELITWRDNMDKNEHTYLWLDLAVMAHGYESDYLNDITGTRLMRQGKFDEALPYLDSVPLTYISRQNISPYMATRKYDTMPWREPRPKVEDRWFVTLNTNPKADYCRYVLDLQRRVDKPTATRADLCSLAAAYINATPRGNCWWLTRYSTSMYDMPEANNDDMDFAGEAEALLNKALGKRPAAGLTDAELIYAQAYLFNITTPDFRQWNWDKNEYVYNFDIDKKHRYKDLATYVKTHPDESYPTYISKCDMLKTSFNNFTIKL